MVGAPLENESRHNFFQLEKLPSFFLNQSKKSARRSISLTAYFIPFYSVLNASTGSFCDACFEGINPAIKDKTTLSRTKIAAASNDKLARTF